MSPQFLSNSSSDSYTARPVYSSDVSHPHLHSLAFTCVLRRLVSGSPHPEVLLYISTIYKLYKILVQKMTQKSSRCRRERGSTGFQLWLRVALVAGADERPTTCRTQINESSTGAGMWAMQWSGLCGGAASKSSPKSESRVEAGRRKAQGAHLSSMRATSAGSVRVSQQLRSSALVSARTFPLACVKSTTTVCPFNNMVLSNNGTCFYLTGILNNGAMKAWKLGNIS